MNRRVLRRNRRTDPTHPIFAKKEFVLFAVSLVVFFGGMTSLAWAVQSHTQAPDNQTIESNEKPGQESAPAETYTGDIKTQGSASSSSSASTSASSSAASTASSSSGERQSVNTASISNANTSSTREQAQQEQNSATVSSYTADAPAETSTENLSYHIVHHTAYQATPIYRTVHHQASIAHELTVGGKTSIEWTTCPVCGERHDSAFNERVLDHVNESFCAACGGRHESAYDEVIYD